MADLQNKVAIITGAGSGIGREAALAFARAGAWVFGADRDTAGLQQTNYLISSEGFRFDLAEVDVSQESDVERFTRYVLASAGRLDIAFNNAGITGETHRIEDYPVEDFDRVVAVNLRSVFLGMKFQIPAMLENGGGAIVNTASVAAVTGPGGMSAYAASKHGVHGLTRVAAMENAARGIRINAIAPGWTETPMVASNSIQNPRFAELARTAIPAKRGADPKEIAAAALWLSSDAASYVVGQLLVIDGGMTIGGFEI